MRRVAAALDVAPMALYRYVPGKAELLDVMVDAVLGEPAPPPRATGARGWSAWGPRHPRPHRRHPWLHGPLARPRRSGRTRSPPSTRCSPRCPSARPVARRDRRRGRARRHLRRRGRRPRGEADRPHPGVLGRTPIVLGRALHARALPGPDRALRVRRLRRPARRVRVRPAPHPGGQVQRQTGPVASSSSLGGHAIRAPQVGAAYAVKLFGGSARGRRVRAARVRRRDPRRGGGGRRCGGTPDQRRRLRAHARRHEPLHLRGDGADPARGRGDVRGPRAARRSPWSGSRRPLDLRGSCSRRAGCSLARRLLGRRLAGSRSASRFALAAGALWAAYILLSASGPARCSPGAAGWRSRWWSARCSSRRRGRPGRWRAAAAGAARRPARRRARLLGHPVLARDGGAAARCPRRVFGVLMSLEPAVAALAGLVVLGPGPRRLWRLGRARARRPHRQSRRYYARSRVSATRTDRPLRARGRARDEAVDADGRSRRCCRARCSSSSSG